MAWRGLHLTQPSRLSLADDQIVVGQEDGEVRLALEDVAWVIIDSPRTSLTAALMSACMAHGVAVVFTDVAHTPAGVALPFHRHHRQAEVAGRQAAATAPLKKRLWQAVVSRKIENQGAALDLAGAGGGRTLREMARRVGSGDPGNIEAQAARYYWGQLWQNFRRQDDADRRNKMLNYGYAVVRSGVARALVAAGLLPAFGLKHASVTNAFNLADDLVEPFRPFVDILAWRAVGAEVPASHDLSLADRRLMASALLGEALLGEDTVTLLTATERAADSLVRAFEVGTPAVLMLPSLAPALPP